MHDDDYVLSTATLGAAGQGGTGGGAGGGSGTATGSNTASQGLVINVTYDPSVANAPAGFVAAFTDAVQFFEATFTDPIAISIDVGYGNVGPDPVSGGAAGQSITYLAGPLSYGDTKAALGVDAASAADATAAASLGATDPTGGGNFVVSTAQAKALGLLAGYTGVDGYVGFSSTIPFTYDPNDRTAPGKYDFIGVAEHEISEVMGRIALVGTTLGSPPNTIPNTYSVLDLFRYSAAGTHQVVAGQTAYFSIDGGATDLRGFNTISGGDDGDWNSAVVDAANAFVGTNQTLPFSAADITAMDAIGYDVACFCRGTRILTAAGETPVEDLAIGDMVVTAAGALRPVKWIGRRSYDGRFIARNPAVLPIRVAAGAIADGVPQRDLHLSPHHALLVEGALVPSELLLNGASVVQLRAVERVDYFHLELEDHDLILAEGAPAETFVDCDSRQMFHNAAEFAALYPDAAPPRWQFCLPRTEGGEALERVRRVLAARAGVPTPAVRAAAAPGSLRGHIDRLDRQGVAGWAYDEDHPAAPVSLEILAGDVVVARVLADRWRRDLADAGWGDGRHAFETALDPPLSPRAAHRIVMRRVADGAPLPGMPMLLPALVGSAVAARLEAADARPFALFVDERVPTPERDAGSNAILDHMRAFLRLGWRVAFAAADMMPPNPTLAAEGIASFVLPDHVSVTEVLQRRGGQFALVYLHRASIAEHYGGLVRRHCPGARLLYGVADLHWLRLMRQARVEGRIEPMAESRRLRLAELAAAAAADAVITHSSYEAAILRRRLGAGKVHVVPWSALPRPRATPWHERLGLAFIGGYRHQPNVDAARWLVREIMPLVWECDPGIPCHLVGPDMPESLARLAGDGVTATGAVGDLGAVFDTVRLSVAPLRYGAGLKGKVIDSLAAGVPCALTPVAEEGFDLPPALRPTVAATPAELAALICRLHADRGENERVAGAGLDLVARAFAPAHIDALLAGVVDAAARHGAGMRSAR